ncbi:NUDIX domain-containing protein [Carboxydochorda subterranea]|uniref:NUDIX domain-containing protein n=1 Tax=Carboxydichorda subterranea TaxID=3109565 RepID=A0ABZ1BXT5_9FIRM|nr:NUDIX domain-containing protein [Limnochorda sp. L945t]WRP17620.1 NUDIX domain-containing protein [Limnochorda sp. L945t]
MKAPDKTVVCRTVRGELRRFPAQTLRFRPAAYGIALQDGQVLVARSHFSGYWELPGGAVAPWETLEEGLAREYQEETGLPVAVGEFVAFDQGFIAFFQHAFNSLRFYYLVRPEASQPTAQKDEVDEVRWIDLGRLSEATMAPGHYQALMRSLHKARA